MDINFQHKTKTCTRLKCLVLIGLPKNNHRNVFSVQNFPKVKIFVNYKIFDEPYSIFSFCQETSFSSILHHWLAIIAGKSSQKSKNKTKHEFGFHAFRVYKIRSIAQRSCVSETCICSCLFFCESTWAKSALCSLSFFAKKCHLKFHSFGGSTWAFYHFVNFPRKKTNSSINMLMLMCHFCVFWNLNLRSFQFSPRWSHR